MLPLLASVVVISLSGVMQPGIVTAMTIAKSYKSPWTGAQVSLGHAGFLAIGAYTSVLLMMKLGFPFLLALPISGLVAALFGFLLGIPALRMEGPYLAIATLGFGIAVEQILGMLKFCFLPFRRYYHF